MDIQTLLDLERGFWFKGSDYYKQHISQDAVFVFPNIRLKKNDGVAAADQAKRWSGLTVEDELLIPITSEVVILTYHAISHRDGESDYKGNITTVYHLEEGQPKMIFHQHTPDE